MGNNASGEAKSATLQPGQAVSQGTQSAVPVVDASGNVNGAAVQTVEIPFSFKSSINSVTESILKVGPWIRQQKSGMQSHEMFGKCKENREYFEDEIGTPLKTLYNTIPEKLSEAKLELISPYSYNQRFTTLNILCAMTAIMTLTMSRVNPVSRVLIATRNSAFTFFIGGLFFAPEIYNPFIRSD